MQIRNVTAPEPSRWTIAARSAVPIAIFIGSVPTTLSIFLIIGLKVPASVRIPKKRIEKMNKETGKKELLSYGEHPYFSGALVHADEDFGLTYEQQYTAKDAKHNHYLTGAYSLPYDALDAHIKDGRSIDVIYCRRWGQYICTTPVPYILHRNNEILWGSSDNILGAILTCLLSFQFEDKEEFEKRI